MDTYKIIKKPLLTEKGTILKEKDNKYIFAVDIRATKNDIKDAVQKIFKVTVLDVNTVNMHGKIRRLGFKSAGKFGKRNNWKKAYIKIKKDQKIEALEV